MEATTELKPNEYQCAECKGIFNKGRTDEEALKASEAMFGKRPIEDCEMICEDCYQARFN